MKYGVKILEGRRRLKPWIYESEENFSTYLKWKEEKAMLKEGFGKPSNIILPLLLVVLGLIFLRFIS